MVVLSHDRREGLLATLDRLAALPERPPVVVVDNASTDGAPAAVARRHPRVTLVAAGGNTGAAGRTLGVRAARTPYVAFSDDDSWWRPGALRRAADLLDAHDRLALLAARVTVEPGGAEDPVNAELAASPLGRAADLPGPRVLGFLACAAVARREAFLAAGGYHPALFVGGEETLLAYDLVARGWGVCHCPEVEAVHRPAGGERPGRRAVLRRNAVLTTWLRRPLGLAVRRTGVLLADARRDPAARAALGGLLVRLPVVLRDRRPLPPEAERLARRLDPESAAAPQRETAAPPRVAAAWRADTAEGDTP
ncbi:glycosyl transferase [Streptomyces solincola]|uniref:Glycosyl transferase n=1 Tax=Streptomyces solincola TaxID=2100817 RepID=A0A2S9PP40_9ACTN|nr:glycosyl transferase [Streptomyces solincola]